MMRVLAVIGAFCFLAASGVAAAETWSNVSLIDTMCSISAKAKPDAHTRACALQCAKSGFGIIAADGSYLKFDDSGNTQSARGFEGNEEGSPLTRFSDR